MEENLSTARSWIREAERMVVFSGAGVSAESGVPTFRGEEGLWRQHRPEELATPQAFARDPRLVWEWYDWRRGLVGRCRPNAAHEAIARHQIRKPGCLIVTQNVDGLHPAALEEARRQSEVRPSAPEAAEVEVLELHGSLFVVRCSRCEYRRGDRARIDASARETLPTCPRCGALLRPGVVWFGEALPHGALEAAFRAASVADVCLVVGTSGRVEPAASVPRATKAGGGRVVVIDPAETALDGLADATFRGPAAEWVPLLM